MKKFKLPNGREISHLNAGETAFLYKEIFEDELYRGLNVQVGESGCVLDVGANIGMFSLWAHQKWPTARIFAFEPIPEVFQILAANFADVKIPGRATNCGLGRTAGQVEFTYYPNNSVMSGQHADVVQDAKTTRSYMESQDPRVADPKLARQTDALLARLFQTRTATCEIKTLSAVIAEHALETIDLLKVDVEKSEADVLAGIEPGDWAKIRHLVVEVHDLAGRVELLAQELEQRGYAVARHRDPTLKNTDISTLYARRG